MCNSIADLARVFAGAASLQVRPKIKKLARLAVAARCDLHPDGRLNQGGFQPQTTGKGVLSHLLQVGAAAR